MAAVYSSPFGQPYLLFIQSSLGSALRSEGQKKEHFACRMWGMDFVEGVVVSSFDLLFCIGVLTVDGLGFAAWIVQALVFHLTYSKDWRIAEHDNIWPRSNSPVWVQFQGHCNIYSELWDDGKSHWERYINWVQNALKPAIAELLRTLWKIVIPVSLKSGLSK